MRALEEEWREHPPVHQLVAAYLDYKPEPARARELTRDDDAGETSTPGRIAWMSGMGSVAASTAFTEAATPAEALAAAERLFFGDVNEFPGR